MSRENIVRVHHPPLTQKERETRMKIIEQAAINFCKEVRECEKKQLDSLKDKTA